MITGTIAALKFPATVDASSIAYKPTTENLSKFRSRNVEQLLNQAADLLDRCIRDKAQWESLRLQDFIFNEQLDEINQRINNTKNKKNAIDSETNNAIADGATFSAEIIPRHPEIDQVLNTAYQMSKKLPNLGQVHAEILQNVIASKKDSLEELNYRRRQERSTADSILVAQELVLAEKIQKSRQDKKVDGQCLDFMAQAQLVEDRLNRDLQDALDRLTAASFGMKSIYGYAEEFSSAESSSGPLNDAILWARNAIEWLSAFQQRDQETTKIFSLKNLFGSNWKTHISHAKDNFDIEVKITNADFLDMAYVRLRGISLFVDCEPGMDPLLCATVSPPKESLYLHLRELDDCVDEIPVIQDDVPPIRVGRIERRGSIRHPDTFGAISAFNASPIGNADAEESKWKLSFSAVSAFDGLFAWSKIDDIFLELRVATKVVNKMARKCN